MKKKSIKRFLIIIPVLVLAILIVFLRANSSRRDDGGLSDRKSHQIKNETTGDYYYLSGYDHLNLDPASLTLYYNDCIEVVTERELTEAEEEELASIVEGKIVGKMTSMNFYQIGIQPTDFKTIDQYVDDLVNYDLVLFSSYCHPDCYESGALEKGSSSQQGTWWTDAIGLDEAHEMGTDSREIKVGIIDDCFDYSHPDLLLESINKAEDSKEYMKQYFWENPFAAIFSREAYNEGRSHGTHVAGLIGAKDNGKGITGAYNDATMNCIGYLGDVYDQYDNYNFLFQTDVLLRYEKCKVINLSSIHDRAGIDENNQKSL